MQTDRIGVFQQLFQIKAPRLPPRRIAGRKQRVVGADIHSQRPGARGGFAGGGAEAD